MAEVKWIKIVTDIFDDEKILLIEQMPEADSIIVIWFKLLCIAGKQNNSGVLTMSNGIAYTDIMLATIFRRKETVVKLALKTFEQFGMIEIIDNAITIPNWGRHQSLDRIEAKNKYQKEYMREYRARQKLLAAGDKGGKANCKTNSKANVSSLDKIREEKDINNLCTAEPTPDTRKDDFEKIYVIYPKKKGKAKAFEYYRTFVSKNGRQLNGERYRLTPRQIYIAVQNYVSEQEQAGTEVEFYKNFDTFMNKTILDYLEVENNE